MFGTVGVKPLLAVWEVSGIAPLTDGCCCASAALSARNKEALLWVVSQAAIARAIATPAIEILASVLEVFDLILLE